MSFESFIDSIEKLQVLPTLNKADNGYEYDEEYVGKLFIHNNALVLFSQVAADEMQLPLLEAIYHAIESGIEHDISEVIGNISDTSGVESCVSDIQKLENAICDYDSRVSDLQSEINELKDTMTSKSELNPSTIQKMIDLKMADAPIRTGKIKITTLNMLKESGFSISEISELSKNELI